jgi:hypothetical protein
MKTGKSQMENGPPFALGSLLFEDWSEPLK